MSYIINMFKAINDLFLKMTWLSDLVDMVLKNIFQMDESSYLFKSVSFFIYDVIKIFILLGVLIYLSAYIQAKFSPEKTKQILTKFSGIKGNIIGALLGTVTPFCSCSSIPIFIGFTKAGLPLGVTFSFLISSPLVDMASVILLASIFNWQIAVLYVVMGLLIAVIGGTLIDKLQMESQVESFILEGPSTEQSMISEDLTKKERHHYARHEVKSIFKKVWVYILVGVGIGALIHGYIPQAFILKILGSNNPFAIWIATFIGIPMYADIFGTLPIAEALVLKGVGVGTVLSFMMGVTALSLPSFMLLKQVIKPKLLYTFLGIVTIGIIITGYVFNYFEFLLI